MIGSVRREVAGHLGDARDRGQRRLGGRGEHATHRDDRVHRRRPDRGAEEVMGDDPERLPAVAPVNSDGANTPPEPPIDSVRLAARILPSIRISDQNHSTYVAGDAPGPSPGSRPRTSAAAASSSAPSAIPPTAGRAHSGPPVHSSSTRSSSR